MISDALIKKAVDAILNDEVIVYPTETAYALGVNATSEKALEKLYALKERNDTKPTHISVLNIDVADEFAIVNDRARKLARAFLPGPLSLVLPSRSILPKILEFEKNKSIGIRFPAHPVARKILEATGVPITATSANASGGTTPYDIQTIEGSFGEKFKNIAVVLNAGKLPNILPSTLVSLMSNNIEILREGPISFDQIRAALQ